MYDEFMHAHRVEELKVLSNLIVYANVVSQRGDGCVYDCALYNRTATKYAEYISNTNLHKTFYFNREDAQEANIRLVRDIRRKSIGQNLEEIFNTLKLPRI